MIKIFLLLFTLNAFGNIEESLKKYRDPIGLIHTDPQPSSSENGILFTYTNIILQNKNGLDDKPDLNHIIKSLTRSDGSIKSSLIAGDRTWSHDNHTAFMSWSKKFGYKYHNNFFWYNWNRRVHPRDIVYYLSLRDDIVGTMAKPFLFITSIAMIVSCYQEYKIRNGRKILKTDGKILAFVRFNTISMPFTEKVCNWLIKNNPKFGSWENVFKIYFKNEDHPNRVLFFNK